MNDIFSIEVDTPKAVVLKVRDLSFEDLAWHPYVTFDYKHIVITKGDEHTLTVYDDSRDEIVSFYWGYFGSTLLSPSLSQLKNECLSFLKKNGIDI